MEISIFSLDELVEKFELEKVHKAGAVFDLKKLDWINAEYIKKLSIDDLYEKALPFFEEKEFYKNSSAEKKSPEFLKKVLTVELDRLPKLSDVGENNQFFFATNLNYDKALLRWKEMSDDDLKKLARLDMTGSAMISTNSENVALVPAWTVLSGKYIWIDNNGTPELKTVTAGKIHGNEIEIIKSFQVRQKVAHALIDTFKAVNNPSKFFILTLINIISILLIIK